jgi:hypothetical protein
LPQKGAKYGPDAFPARNRRQRDISNGLLSPTGRKRGGFDRADRGLTSPKIFLRRLQESFSLKTLAVVAVGVRKMLMIADLPESASG